MGKDFIAQFTNKHGHKSYSLEDIEAGAACKCVHCAALEKVEVKKAVKKEEKKE